MGLSSVASYVILFIVVIGMVFILISAHTQIIKERGGAVETLSDIREKKGSTQIEVEDIYVTPENATFLIRNSGDEKIHLDRINTYLEEPVENSAYLVERFNVLNPQIWDPDEKINLTVPGAFAYDMNYTLTINTENAESVRLIFRNMIMEMKVDAASKTSGPVVDVVSKINESDDDYASLDIGSGATENISINFTEEGNYHAYSSNLTVEHLFNESTLVTEKDLYYHDGGWQNVGTFSGYEVEGTDEFDIASGPSEFLINYHSENPGDVRASIDYVLLVQNITRWWVFND